MSKDTDKLQPTASRALVERRLELFDEATARQREREGCVRAERSAERGWTREELYDRGRPR